jgi:DNA-directed RNA polymerase specialized sigma24 family protein
MTGSVGDAEDIVQDAFLGMTRARQAGTTITDPKAYLTTTVTRLGINYLNSSCSSSVTITGGLPCVQALELNSATMRPTSPPRPPRPQLSIVAFAQAAVRATATSGAGAACTVQLHFARYGAPGVSSVHMPGSFLG